MTLAEAVLESWDRQASIVLDLAKFLPDDWLSLRANEGEMTIGEHLCHIHQVRSYWLSMLAPEFKLDMCGLFDENWQAIVDRTKILAALEKSAREIRAGVGPLLVDGAGEVGPYRHPMHFVEHMVWHEGWHVGAIMHAMRQNGHEQNEEWEDALMWGRWRTYG